MKILNNDRIIKSITHQIDDHLLIKSCNCDCNITIMHGCCDEMTIPKYIIPDLILVLQDILNDLGQCDHSRKECDYNIKVMRDIK